MSVSVADVCSVDVYMLCGGLGTRLRGVVPDRPKPMAAIGERPFLDLLVDHVASFGFRRIVLGVGHMAEAVEKHFGAIKSPARIAFSREDKPLGTAGALFHARTLLKSDPVIVMNGDSFCHVDFQAMLSAHCKAGADATIAVVPVAKAGDYGSVGVGRDGRIVSFEEKAGTGRSGMVNAGIYVFKRSVIDGIGSRVPLSLEKDVFPGLAAGNAIAWRVAGPLLDIGTPERYEKAKRELASAMKARPAGKGSR